MQICCSGTLSVLLGLGWVICAQGICTDVLRIQ